MNSAKKILEYCNKATPGPLRVEPDIRPDVMTVWCVEGEGGFGDGGHIIKGTGQYASEDGELHVVEFAKYPNAMNDAEFFANARTDLPAVTNAAVDLRRALKEWWPMIVEYIAYRTGDTDEVTPLLDATAWLEDGDG